MEMKRDKRVNLSSYEHETSVERATGALNGSTTLHNAAIELNIAF